MEASSLRGAEHGDLGEIGGLIAPVRRGRTGKKASHWRHRICGGRNMDTAVNSVGSLHLLVQGEQEGRRVIGGIEFAEGGTWTQLTQRGNSLAFHAKNLLKPPIRAHLAQRLCGQRCPKQPAQGIHNKQLKSSLGAAAVRVALAQRGEAVAAAAALPPAFGGLRQVWGNRAFR